MRWQKGSTWGLDKIPPEDWRELAACREYPDVMYPDGNAGAIAAAKQVCASCPVTDECLAEAVRLREPFGVWGGKTPEERKFHSVTRECTKCGAKYQPVRPNQKRCSGCRDGRSSVVRRNAAQCGTSSGYDRHAARAEPSCEPCRAANAAKVRQWRANLMRSDVRPRIEAKR